jgi:hypothetical protein
MRLRRINVSYIPDNLVDALPYLALFFGVQLIIPHRYDVCRNQVASCRTQIQ